MMWDDLHSICILWQNTEIRHIAFLETDCFPHSALSLLNLCFTFFFAIPRPHLKDSKHGRRKREREREGWHKPLVHQQPSTETENRTSLWGQVFVTIAVNQAGIVRNVIACSYSEELETLVGDRAVETCLVDLVEEKHPCLHHHLSILSGL